MLLGASRRLNLVTRSLTRTASTQAALAARFSELTNLADDRLGAKILFATDEWFATADNMLKPTEPHFDPETFCVQGKVMDGWESRRRRLAGHDWSVVKLGLAGYVHGLELDTAHFTGNQVPAASVFAACIEEEEDEGWLGPPRSTLGVQGTCATPEEIAEARARVEAAAEWIELLPISKLRPGYTEDGRHGLREDGQYSVHRFAVPAHAAKKRVTHLLVNQHPDGGLARMRAWGVVGRDYDTELAASAVGSIDLLSALNGGRAVGCSNKHYGEPRNLLRPGRGVRMDDGWETARNPRRPHEIVKDPETGLVHMPGAEDWCVLRLAAVAGKVSEVVIDTANFRGNFPESVLVEACNAADAPSSALLGGEGADAIKWEPLLARTRLGPDAIHTFSAAELVHERASTPTTHVRVTILPDGGISRVRVVGEAVEAMPPEEPQGAGWPTLRLRGGSEGGEGSLGKGGGGDDGDGGGNESTSEQDLATTRQEEWENALNWSQTQGHILSGGGKAEALYTKERGYAYSFDELPHYHLLNGSTRAAFEGWSREAREGNGAPTTHWMAGAWNRTIFSGGGMATTDADETCLNLISPEGPFIDIRIPNARDRLLGGRQWDAIARAVEDGSERPLASLTDLELRLLSRQHAFGGFGRVQRLDAPASEVGEAACEAVCTRHHAIDWNFVGSLRPRPNKWRIKAKSHDDWEELAFADDETGAPYYFERWVRASGDDRQQPSLALRTSHAVSSSPTRDALVIISGGYFSYVVERPIDHSLLAEYGTTLFGVVDEALKRGDRGVAERCVLQESGYGRIGEEWTILASLQPWRIGSSLANVFGGATGSNGADRLQNLSLALRKVSTLARSPDERLELQIGDQSFTQI